MSTPIHERIAMRLEAAAGFAEDGDRARAAAELVVAWQLGSMTTVAELVVACDTRAPVTGVTAKKVAGRELACFALAEQLDEANLPPSSSRAASRSARARTTVDSSLPVGRRSTVAQVIATWPCEPVLVVTYA